MSTSYSPSWRGRPCLLLLNALLFTVPALAAPFQTTIQSNGTQGDLVTVLQAGKPLTVRLFGVSCPVSGQPMAESATTYLLETAMDAAVNVEIVAKDTTGTPIAWVKLPDGTSLNEQLVHKGLAWWDAPNAPEARAIQKAATEAIAAGRGLWSTPAPLAPWDYRASHGIAAVRYEKPEPASTTSETTTTRPVVIPKEMKAQGDGTGSAAPAEEDYFPEDPAEHLALMLKHQPRIAYDKAGKPVGLTATDIVSVPGARRFGLQNGDVVSSVNGIALTDEAQVLGLVTQLQNAKRLDLTVLRNGKSTQIAIPLE